VRRAAVRQDDRRDPVPSACVESQRPAGLCNDVVGMSPDKQDTQTISQSVPPCGPPAAAPNREPTPRSLLPLDGMR
jgi:hypothetical protein